MTDFQTAIYDYLRKQKHPVSAAHIAQNVFPAKWAKRSGHGALIGHVDRAALKLPDVMRWHQKTDCQHERAVFQLT